MNKTLAYVISTTTLLIGAVGGVSLGLAINDRPVAACEEAFDRYEQTTTDLAKAGTSSAQATAKSLEAAKKGLGKDFEGAKRDLDAVDVLNDEVAEHISAVQLGREGLPELVEACKG